MAKEILTAERLRAVVDYDPETGHFTRTLDNGQRSSARSWKNRAGYIYMKIDGRLYSAHRLAWFYSNGDWPSKWVDHVDGDKSNNSLSNLRESTVSENQQNQRRSHVDGESRFLGVSRVKFTNRWMAKICIDRRQHYLGTFDSREEAHIAYLEAKRQLHGFCTI